MTLGYSASEPRILEHIGFGRQMTGVSLGGLYLFQTPEEDVLRALGKLDDQPYVYMGFVAFLRIGVALTGFHDRDTSQKAVSLFQEGAWEKRRARLTPFVIPHTP
jgi:hypothetical protein